MCWGRQGDGVACRGAGGGTGTGCWRCTQPHGLSLLDASSRLSVAERRMLSGIVGHVALEQVDLQGSGQTQAARSELQKRPSHEPGRRPGATAPAPGAGISSFVERGSCAGFWVSKLCLVLELWLRWKLRVDTEEMMVWGGTRQVRLDQRECPGLAQTQLQGRQAGSLNTLLLTPAVG